MEMLELVVSFATIVTGLGAAWIVWLSHRLARRQRADAWLTQFNDLHQRYWDDPDFRQIRLWLTSDEAYKDLRAALETRLSQPGALSTDQCRRIEVLDKFLNFLIRVRLVDANLEAKQDLWKDLQFAFWMDAIITRQRCHIVVYVKHFFGPSSSLGELLREPDVPDMQRELAEIRSRLSSEIHLPD